LGEGSFGKVFSGICKLSCKKVAIKQINKENMCKTELEYQMLETAIIRACESQFVVKMLDEFEDENYIYIVQEFIDGTNLL